MKEVLSYWDISLGVVSIVLGIVKLCKFEKLREHEEKLKRTGNFLEDLANGYTKHTQDNFFYTVYYGLIIIGIIFIYNRLNGNLPNIITFIKNTINPY